MGCYLYDLPLDVRLVGLLALHTSTNALIIVGVHATFLSIALRLCIITPRLGFFFLDLRFVIMTSIWPPPQHGGSADL